MSMLGALGKFVVKVADLAEAEGRVARRHLLRLGAAMLIGLAAMVMFVLGVGAAGVGLYLALIEATRPPVALAIIGAILLCLAAILAVVAWRAVAIEGD